MARYELALVDTTKGLTGKMASFGIDPDLRRLNLVLNCINFVVPCNWTTCSSPSGNDPLGSGWADS